MQSVGIIGLGTMGGNMAARYVDAGYTVYGNARDRDKAQRLVELGLRWVGSPRELVEQADVVLTSLPDDEVVEAVASGPAGILAGLGAGKVWADLSTITPRLSRELAERVRGEGHGGVMLDTPVSGSVPQVNSGTLTIMVGGDEAAFARIKPVLEVLGTPVRVGNNGHGLVLKLAINISLAVQMLAFSEGLLMAQRDGIDLRLAAAVMTDSPIGSPMLRARVPLVLDRHEETWFDIALMHKDIRLARAAGSELGTPLPSAGLADHILDEAERRGHTHRDIAAIYQVLAELPTESAQDAECESRPYPSSAEGNDHPGAC